MKELCVLFIRLLCDAPISAPILSPSKCEQCEIGMEEKDKREGNANRNRKEGQAKRRKNKSDDQLITNGAVTFTS